MMEKAWGRWEWTPSYVASDIYGYWFHFESGTAGSEHYCHIATWEGTQTWYWPEWLDDQAWNWIEAITFEYDYPDSVGIAPMYPTIELWNKQYLLPEGEHLVDLWFPIEKPLGEIKFETNKVRPPDNCPRPKSLLYPVLHESEIVIWWNPWLRKNCFEVDITEHGPLWFWPSRAEGNPPILCPPSRIVHTPGE